MKLTPATLTVAMLLIVGGLVTAFVAKRMFLTDEVAYVEPINVPMALTDLKPGTVITEAHLGMAPIPPSSLDREILQTSRVVVGRYVKNPITRAEPIRTSDLYAPGERPPLEIAEGMRAVAVAVNGASLLDGIIEPGRFVDVHFSPRSVPPQRGGVATLFQGIRVLAMNRPAAVNPSVSPSASTVTLELSPQQTSLMLLARDRGNIDLTYAPEGPGAGGIAGSSSDRELLNEMLGLTAPAPPFATQIFNGSSVLENQFEGGRMLRDPSGSPARATAEEPETRS